MKQDLSMDLDQALEMVDMTFEPTADSIRLWQRIRE